MKRIYLDYAASSPVDPRVLRAMQPYFSAKFGNPGSLHASGQAAIAALDASREIIAKSIGADFREIIFTASATEANNLALRGAVRLCKEKNPDVAVPKIIISAIEHESVLETARDLEKDGVEVIYLPVDENGLVDIKKLESSLDDRTALVSIMHANNEIGTIEPLRSIADTINNFRNNNSAHHVHPWPLFHTDAAQAFQFFDCTAKTLGVQMMTLSSHKMCGPKGAGALYAKRFIWQRKKGETIISGVSQPEFALKPQTTGGGQEFGMRSGTENVAAIVGFGKAVELLGGSAELTNARKKMEALNSRLWKGIKKIYSKAEINGPRLGEGLPNILNIYFPGASAEDMLTKLDLLGVAASSGSACRSRALESSYVISALGYSLVRAKSSLRFSAGRFTTTEEIDRTVKLLKKTLDTLVPSGSR